MDIEVKDQTLLKQADFEGNWQGIPMKVWCDNLVEEQRPPSRLSNRTVYRCEKGWVKPEGSEDWTLIGLVRIFY